MTSAEGLVLLYLAGHRRQGLWNVLTRVEQKRAVSRLTRKGLVVNRPTRHHVRWATNDHRLTKEGRRRARDLVKRIMGEEPWA